MINPLIALRRRDHLIGFGLALLHLTFLLSTAAQVGVPRDESFYFYAADRAADWVDGLFDSKVASFSRTEIDRGFEYNHEHPVLMKMLFGVSHRVLHDKLGVIDSNMTAYRLPTMVMAALASWLAFLLGLMLHGRLAGVLGALAGILIPRVFFHSHLACFDGPVTFMTLLICYTYLRAARSRGWAIACGVAFGLGLATKLNTFFVPFTLLAVAALDTWTFRRRTGAWRAPAGQRGPLTYYSWIAVSLIVLGLVVFLAHWPWLYYDTLPRLRSYFAFHARHVDYPVDYFGFLYFKPPFPVHYPFVMSAITIPLGILLAGLIGFGVFARSARACFKAPADAPDRRSAEAMVLANVFVPFAIIAVPYTPIFGGIKHWMPAMPFFAVLAGVGLVRLGTGLWPRLEGRKATLATIGLSAFMLAPAAWATVTYGPEGPVYFNELAGGPPGAAALGMPRNFWGHSTISILPAVNERVEKRAYVWWHKATQWAIDAYKRDGLLRGDVRYTGDWTAPYSDWAVYHDQREKMPEELDAWRAYGTEWPVDGHYVDGLQIMALYHRPAPPAVPPIPPGGR